MSIPDRRLKDAIYEQLARIGKAFSSPRRIEILDLLSQSRRSVESVASQTGLSIANTSRHLQILRAARLVDAQRAGTSVYYCLADPSVAGFVRSLRMLAEKRLAEMEQITKAFLEGTEEFEQVGRAELIRRVRSGKAVVLDVRPAEEYRSGHLPRAISIPLEQLESRLTELPRDREIVAYCRGPYCLLAFEAVEVLRSQGFRAWRLDMDVVEWQASGFPLEYEI